MSTRYVFKTPVISVNERKDADGNSLGWFVRITESSAIAFGHEKPELVVGDIIKITIEKV